MANIAGFELPQGVAIQDLDSWPSFVEWYESEYYVADPEDSECRNLFEAYLAGAYWEHSGEHTSQ